MSGHTKARWMMAAAPSSVVGWPIVAQDGRSIASLTYMPKAMPGAEEFNAESIANGKLIVAAQALLDALETCLEAINPPDRSGISLDTWNKRLKAASEKGRAALALLEEQP